MEIPTEMPEILVEMLTNLHFNFNELTWDDVTVMMWFWITRGGQPRHALHVWSTFLKNNDELYHRYVETMEILMEPAPVGFDALFTPSPKNGRAAEDSKIFAPFIIEREKFNRLVIQDVPPLENFNEKTAALQHGRWPHFKDRTAFIF